MSLTSELRRSASPVRYFFEHAFPRVDTFWSAWRERVQGLPTLRPSGNLSDYPWALVGGAIDYRLRAYWRSYKARDTVAAQGAMVALGQGFGDAFDLWGDVATAWDRLMRTARPARRVLPPDDEARLARLCVVLAAYEQVWRSGQVNEMLTRVGTLDDLLARVPAAVVDDLGQLLAAFWRSGPGEAEKGGIVLNPTFSGSADVGGADGDIILDGVLWDYKTSVSPTKSTNDTWPYQLLGYGLLDYSDRYHLTGAGIYLVRQGAWISWTWGDLVALLEGDTSVPLAEWRERFREGLGLLSVGQRRFRW